MVKIERVGFLILFALIFWVPGVSGFIFGAALQVTDLLGVSRPAVGAGWQAFHFVGLLTFRPDRLSFKQMF